MSETYVVAIDGSQNGWKALKLAVRFSAESDAELVLTHVVPFEPIPKSVEAWAETEGLSKVEMRARFHQDRSIGDKIIHDAERRAQEAGCERVTTRVVEGHVAGEIVAVAKNVKAGMIFLGSRGLSDLQGLLLGSVSHRVAHLAPCSCVIVR
ncbi:MAG: universal stress protein [Alphaproteobacteria bacterium]